MRCAIIGKWARKREALRSKVVLGGKQRKMIGQRRKSSLGTYEIWRNKISLVEVHIVILALQLLTPWGNSHLPDEATVCSPAFQDYSLLTLIAPSFTEHGFEQTFHYSGSNAGHPRRAMAAIPMA
jgi:hypothetical protein